MAQRLKAEIRAATSLTASAGVAPNKFLAKIASAWRKPDGLTVIAPERMETFLQQLPVDALWGVGPVTAERLRERGITRLVDVRSADPAVLREAVGSGADWLRQLADGHRRSTGRLRVRAEILWIGKHLFAGPDRHPRDPPGHRRDGARRGAVAGAEGAALPDGDDQGPLLRLHDRHAQPQRAGRRATPEDLAQRAVALLDKTEAGRRPVRLLGASVHNLIDPDTPTEEPMLPFEEEDR